MVFVLDTRQKNQLAKADMPVDKNVAKYVRCFLIGKGFGVHVVILD